MPNPHFRVSIISRKAGQNAVASAAYRAGETLYYDRHLEAGRSLSERSALNAAAYQAGDTLTDEKCGQIFSFVGKEGILHKEIHVPANAPAWARDRQELWNQVEKAEDKSTRRATAHLARDFVASLPRELSHDEHRTLVARFVQDNFTRRGLVADVAFHSVKARDGKQNPHVHMMVATRTLDTDGFGKKPVWLEKKAALYAWRQSWEHHTNRMLDAAGRPERLSLQTYKAQGIDREGRKSLTREEYALEQKGIRTKRGDENRAIARRNAERELQAQRRLQPKDGGPLWSDFSTRVGTSVDAARSTVHRHRAKEQEAQGRVLPEYKVHMSRLKALRSSASKTATYLKNQIRGISSRAETQAAQARASRPSAVTRPPGSWEKSNAATSQGRQQEYGARQNNLQQSAQAQARTSGLAQTGVQFRGNERNGQEVSPSPTPNSRQTSTTQRYQGRTKDGNDTPRQGPGTPPAGINRGRGTETANNRGAYAPQPRLDAAARPASPSANRPGVDHAARMNDATKASAQQAATMLKQSGVSMEGQAKQTQQSRGVDNASAQVATKYAQAKQQETQQPKAPERKGRER